MKTKPARPRAEQDLDSILVEEITTRLPTAELAKIIRGALDFGRHNRPFTQSDLLRAMTFGVAPATAHSAKDARRSGR